jgi:manganese transport protein
MEGYLNFRLQPWIRRLITRLIAIVPAFITILILGESATGKMLIFSQVILSLQLGFAIIPLIHFVSDKNKMGEFVIPLWQKILSWISASTIILLNVKLVYSEIADLITTSSNPILISFTIVPACVFCLLMLLYILLVPFITKKKTFLNKGLHEEFKPLILNYSSTSHRIAVTVDFSTSDNKAINKAIQLGDKNSTLILIHVLESTNAMVYGENAFDLEREEDFQKLKQYQEQLLKENIQTEIQLGFGNPKQAIPQLILKNNCDTLVMGTHGHKTMKDIILGTTIESVRHEIKIPLVLV